MRVGNAVGRSRFDRFLRGERPMTDTQRVVQALKVAGKILAAHVEPGQRRDAEETIGDLIAVLDTQELSRACERLEKRSELRVVK